MVSSISRFLEYQIAARAPSVKRQFFTVNPSLCQNGYLPSKRQFTAFTPEHSFNADSPAWIVTFSKMRSRAPNSGRSPSKCLFFICFINFAFFMPFRILPEAAALSGSSAGLFAFHYRAFL